MRIPQAREKQIKSESENLTNQFDKWRTDSARAISKLGQKSFYIPGIFILILLLGVFTRVWKFGRMPPGLNIDEASIGIEAYDLYHFRVDRNGNSFPVYFESWGSGANALDGYVLIPFIAMGLNPTTVRLPALLSGILSLPLIFWIGKKSIGKTYALLAMFLAAISPGLILMSRWGNEENILPFLFGLGFFCLLLSSRKNIWFAIGMAFFGLCLYAYIACFVAVPVFLACAVTILFISKRLNWKTLLAGLLIFFLLIAPLIAYVIINTWGLDTIHLGRITIPRLPMEARFLTMSATSAENPIQSMVQNFFSMIHLLFITQDDGSAWNLVNPYGYLYIFSVPFIIAGIFLLIPSRRDDHLPEKLLFLSWLVAAGSIGVFQQVNFNRINLIFLPFVFCASAFLFWLGRQNKPLIAIVLAVYLLSYLSFFQAYRGPAYRKQASVAFNEGAIPALEYASQGNNHPICVTTQMHDLFIYVIYNEHLPPQEYLGKIKYSYPDPTSKTVLSLDRYTFGLDACSNQPDTIYVLASKRPPDNGIEYQFKDFVNFRVYKPVGADH